RKDLGEQTDLAEKLPERATALRHLLHDWRDAVDAKMPSPNPNYGKGRAEPEPAKPLKEGAKDDEFDVLRAAAVDDHRLGYALRTRGTRAMGLALKKLDQPLTGKATFKVQLQSLATDRSPGTWRNGFLVFGAGTDEDDLVQCGLFLGGRRFYSILEGNQKVERPLPGDPLRPFELEVTVDLAARRVVMRCEKITVQAKLSRPLEAITHVGYAATNTTTAFSPIAIERQ
ncbi:MAG: hypothetical protein ACODAJ_12815, partial [Planctomycetota bacterium]